MRLRRNRVRLRRNRVRLRRNRARPVGGGAAAADQESRDQLDRLLGRREADALDLPAAEPVEALERERQVGAALVAGDGVDLVDDDGRGAREALPALVGGEQDVERFGRRDEDVGRAAHHRLALARGRVAGPHGDADLGELEAGREGALADLGERLLEVLPDVVAERLQGGDVDDGGLVGQPSGPRRPDQPVDRPEEGGERLTRARGRGDQRVPAGGDRAPTVGLRRRRRCEALGEPAGDERVEVDVVREVGHARATVASATMRR